jgi:hypothetical protein
MDFVLVGLPQALAELGPAQFQRILDWTCLGLGLWCVMSTAEWMRQIALFDDRGLLSWRILSLRASRICRSALPALIFQRRGVALILAARLACGAIVAFPIESPVRIGFLAAIVLTGWLLKLRRWLSDDGSDQMGQIVAIGATIAAVGQSLQDLSIAGAGILLIAGQLIIAYFLGGAAKLISPEWRSGRAIIGIMGTESFGHDFAARITSASIGFSVLFCRLLILVELTFPIAVLCPPPILVGFLAVFALFHIATAMFMGLNTYVWSFGAAYPAVWMLNAVVLSAMHRG